MLSGGYLVNLRQTFELEKIFMFVKLDQIQPNPIWDSHRSGGNENGGEPQNISKNTSGLLFLLEHGKNLIKQ